MSVSVHDHVEACKCANVTECVKCGYVSMKSVNMTGSDCV